MSEACECPLHQLSKNGSNSGREGIFVCLNWLKQTLLLLYSSILEHEMVNLHPQGNPSTIGDRNFERQAVCAKEKVSKDQPSAKNKWVMFMRPSGAV